jgi:hypothetical protein
MADSEAQASERQEVCDLRWPQPGLPPQPFWILLTSALQASNLSVGPQALTQALWYAVGQMVDEKVIPENLNATPQFIAALTQVVWSHMGRSFDSR